MITIHLLLPLNQLTLSVSVQLTYLIVYVSVTQMLEELTWVPLSKRRENARLILFYKIINNLAMVPHSCLEKADRRTRKKYNLKFRHIGYNVDPYG